ncbi:MAG: 30S ribosomal protein S18 [Mycoplasmoidaceae bacterium]
MEKRTPRKNKRKILKKRPCLLCAKGIDYVDYKDVELLQRYLTPSCKIVPRRVSGLCQKHQRMIANAIKRARIVALLPFIKTYE